jgi:DnaK suppressor protein
MAGYNSALSRLKGTHEEHRLVAVKKPAKKAAKAAKHVLSKAKGRAEGKTSKPAASKAVAKKATAKKPVARKPAPKKAPAKKVVAARKPAAKKVAPKKAAAKPVAKKAAVKKVPAKKVAPKKAVPAKKPAPAKAAPAARQPAKPVVARKPAAPAKAPSRPIAKAVAKPEKKSAIDPKPTAAGVRTALAGNPASPVTRRPLGKVAVAIPSRPAPPAPRGKVKVIPYKTDDAGRPILPHGYRPSADEEYMGTLMTEYFRQRLLSWRADLVEESKQTIENLKDEVRDVGDEAERATRETENSLELRTRDRYRKLIGKIDSTLKRVDAGEYGYSVDSGEEIGLERLEARLTAERTIDEQERWEHLQKQIGD